MHNSQVTSNNFLRNIKLCAKNELSYVYYDIRSKLSGNSDHLDNTGLNCIMLVAPTHYTLFHLFRAFFSCFDQKTL